MNQQEFLDAVIAPVKQITATRTQDEMKLRLLDLTLAPVSDDMPIVIGCFGQNYRLVFGTEANFEVNPMLEQKLSEESDTSLSDIVHIAAEKFCQSNAGSLPEGGDLDTNVIVEMLFLMYRRSRGSYTPRPGYNLRIANLHFVDIHSDDRAVFLAYWTKRR
jgi:hypothetical protein